MDAVRCCLVQTSIFGNGKGNKFEVDGGRDFNQEYIQCIRYQTAQCECLFEQKESTWIIVCYLGVDFMPLGVIMESGENTFQNHPRYKAPENLVNVPQHQLHIRTVRLIYFTK